MQLQAQVRKYAIIDKIKRDTYNFEDTTKIKKRQRKDKGFYTVYSDRSDNKVYFSSDAQITGDQQDFLAPYYVIDQKDNYLEVVTLDPKLIGKPKGIFSLLFKGKYTFSDAKKMKYIGWIHKDNVLHYPHPKLSKHNYKPIRYVVGIHDIKTLFNIEDHVKKQTVFLYKDPIFQEKSDKKLSLDQFVYLYKYDTNKKAALVSNLDHMKPSDSTSRVMGWIPETLIKKVGQQRVYVIDEVDSLGFLRKENKRIAYVDKKDIESNIIFDLSEHQKRSIRLQDSIEIVLPLAVWDHSDNKLINVDGEDVLMDKIETIKRENKIINFHYVFDCSDALKKKHLMLMSSLQQIWVLLSTEEKYSDYEISFSASSYGCNKFYSFPKSASFSSWVDFLHNIFMDNGLVTTNELNTKGIEQCFENAIAGMPQQSFTNNIILIAGEKRFLALPNIKDITTKLGQTSSRLIFYQLENKANDQHQDFILQSKDILSRVGMHHADFIRAFIVDNTLIKSENVFSNIPAIDNIYVYDAPKNSTYQGGVAFPKINKKLQATSLDTTIDSVLTTSIKFNLELINSLEYHIGKLGFLRSKAGEEIKEFILKNTTYADSLHIIPRNYMYEKYYKDKHYTPQDNPKVSTAYVLSKDELVTVVDEYKSLIPLLRKIAKTGDRIGLYFKYRKKSRAINRNLFRKTLRRRDYIADLIFMKTGLPVQSEFLQKTKIKHIYRKRKTSHLDFTKIVKELREKVDVLEKILSDKEPKVYTDGGKIKFYMIPEHYIL
ncbi:type VI secretion system protein TssR domain-containing protein [Aquimarina algiphila]|uniref:type VI secretion system protein TssR domain-containing protein n=1 Tax=Aquimarina algiphila TaxID=2047982 RepID=UPI00232F923A|nr:type VI secretion system protein TssR domain-containing protein [Aquimarina algiphila]